MDTINEKIFKIEPFDEDGNIKTRVIRHLLFFIYSEYVNAPGNYNCTIKLISNGADFQDVDRLEGIVLEFAHKEGLEPEFMDWIERTNPLNIRRTY
jgi:hypothetical protein